MLKLTTKLTTHSSYTSPAFTLTLPYERRIISRQRVTLDDGTEAGLFLARGTILQAGEVLQADTGELVTVQAALEQVATAHCDNPLLLARACYHLGNRHIPVQIMPDRVCYQPDHVLDEMLRHLGLTVIVESAPFTPEAGAYHSNHTHHAIDD